MDELDGTWEAKIGSNEYQPGWQDSIEYTCAFCGRQVASERGWTNKRNDFVVAEIRICPNCNRPTFLERGSQYPGSSIGESVEHLPKDIASLYNEARVSAGAGAPTSAVLALRKLLMNVAVNKGAKPGLNFVEYVDYLADKGYVPPDGKYWVDHIRNKGNDANHEIALMQLSDTEELLTFAGMLLKFIYEFPARIKIAKRS